MIRAWRDEAGVTLADLLMAVFFVAIVSLITVGFVRTAVLAMRTLAVKISVQEDAMMLVDLVRREVRMAGFAGGGPPVAGLRIAQRDALALAADLDGDGALDDANELIAYGYDAARAQVVRGTGGAPPQPVVSDVPPGGAAFRYFGADGNELAPLARPDATQSAAIRRIDVEVTIERPNPNPGAPRPLRSVLRTAICRRNP